VIAEIQPTPDLDDSIDPRGRQRRRQGEADHEQTRHPDETKPLADDKAREERLRAIVD